MNIYIAQQFKMLEIEMPFFVVWGSYHAYKPI